MSTEFLSMNTWEHGYRVAEESTSILADMGLIYGCYSALHDMYYVRD